jgi:hypothetical protein
MQRFTVTGTSLPKLALVLMLVLNTAACSTTRVQSSSERDSIVAKHDTVFIARFLHDSTFIDRYHTMIANDSVVFVHDSVVQYKFRTKHDSIYINKTDTAFVEHTEVKRVEVPRKRNWLDYTCYCVTGKILLFLLTYLLTILKKRG